MIWLWLTIIYLVFLTAAELINKKTINNVSIDEVVFGAVVQLTTAAFAFIFAMIGGWRFTFTLESTLLYVGMGITYFFAVTFYFIGLKKIDVSLVSIISSLGSIFSLLFGAIFLREATSLGKLIGIGAIIAANAILFINGRISGGIKYILITAASSFFYALGAVFDKTLNTYGNALSYLTLSFLAAGVSMLLVHYKRTIKAYTVSFRNKKFWYGVSINGLLYALGFWALFSAYQRGGEVSRMFPITMSTAIIIPLAGIVILGERTNIVRKLVAASVAFVGLYILGTH